MVIGPDLQFSMENYPIRGWRWGDFSPTEMNGAILSFVRSGRNTDADGRPFIVPVSHGDPDLDG